MNKQELEARIIKHSQGYYDGDPSLSDLEFDKLVQQLRDIDPDNKLLTTTGWGYSTEESVHRTKYEHSMKVAGINNKINISDDGYKTLQNYKDKYNPTDENPSGGMNFYIQHKLDGISAVCYYSRGELTRVLTRGDGTTGIDITQNIKNIIPNNLIKVGNINSEFILNNDVAIRGELVMPLNNFDKNTMTNPCSSASGLALSNKGDGIDKLDFVAYDLFTDLDNSVLNYGDKITMLSDLKFKVVKGNIVKENILEQYNTSKDTFDCQYPCDGSVIRVINYNDITDMFVFKYPEKQYTSEVVAIHNQLSPYGNIIPVIEIKPTATSRCTVRRMSGFNYKCVLNNQISKGAVIKFHLANGIIPNFDSVIETNNTEFSKLEEELVDRATYIHDTGNIKIIEGEMSNTSKIYWDGVHLRINRDKGTGIIYNILEHYSPDSISYAKINDLIDNWLGKASAPLMHIQDLRSYLDDTSIQDIENFCSEAYVNKYKEWFNDMWNKPLTLQDVINLSITDNVGDTAAKIIDNSFTPDQFLTSLESPQFINELKDKCSLPTYLSYKGLDNNKFNILSILMNFRVISSPKDDKEKTKVSFTGKLSKSRGQLIKDWNVEEVSLSNAQYLITNTPESSTSKNKEAKRLGIKSISEQEFIKTL